MMTNLMSGPEIERDREGGGGRGMGGGVGMKKENACLEHPWHLEIDDTLCYEGIHVLDGVDGELHHLHVNVGHCSTSHVHHYTHL